MLVAIREHADGTIGLVFDVSGRSVEKTADLVVLALPFSTLRHVDLDRSGLSATKRHVIRTMGMGTNAKIHLELSHKTWPALGYSGATYGEWQHLACGWDDTVQLGADASPALYLAFPGGRVGRTGLTGAAHGPAPARDVRWALGEIEHAVPGHDRGVHGPRLRGPLGPGPLGARRLLLLPGRARPPTTVSWPAPPRAASCSPASTPRSTTSASSTVRSRPASGPPGGCSAASAPD